MKIKFRLRKSDSILKTLFLLGGSNFFFSLQFHYFGNQLCECDKRTIFSPIEIPLIVEQVNSSCKTVDESHFGTQPRTPTSTLPQSYRDGRSGTVRSLFPSVPCLLLLHQSPLIFVVVFSSSSPSAPLKPFHKKFKSKILYIMSKKLLNRKGYQCLQ